MEDHLQVPNDDGNYSVKDEEEESHEDFFAPMLPLPTKVAHTLCFLIMEVVGNGFIVLLVAYDRSRPEVEHTLLNYIGNMFFIAQGIICNGVANWISLFRVWLGPTSVQLSKANSQFTQVVTIFNMLTILVRKQKFLTSIVAFSPENILHFCFRNTLLSNMHMSVFTKMWEKSMMTFLLAFYLF